MTFAARVHEVTKQYVMDGETVHALARRLRSKFPSAIMWPSWARRARARARC